jgi:NAD(P) transhydrogenase subunit beta
MFASAQALAYLAAAMLFILSLRGLSAQETARRGNLFGIIGMGLAITVTCYALMYGRDLSTFGEASGILGGAIAVGGIVGALVAARVAMTSMPELVAILHSFVGAAAVLVGVASYLEPDAKTEGAHEAEIFIGVFIGAVTFTGSVIAFFKLRGTIGSKPLLLPARHALNAVMVGAAIVLGVLFLGQPDPVGLPWLLGMIGIASLLGIHLVMAIGGGDMPVVVSLLNSYSGWAASAAGFMLGNDLLIITGALVGSSGAILSTIMCRAMNRSIWNVVFGGFGVTPTSSSSKGAQPAGKVHETNAGDVAQLLLASKRVVIVPGYGMAVAQAQHPVRDLTDALQKRGIDVKFGIHPVAGRLPGHMNVLLAEANVSYDIVKEMDEINPEFERTDVVLIIGANDVVNPSALTDEHSPIYGMPVLEAWKAAHVIMLKRGMSAGYAGVDNAICYNDNTLMLFGDAKQSITKLLAAVQLEAKAA